METSADDEQLVVGDEVTLVDYLSLHDMVMFGDGQSCQMTGLVSNIEHLLTEPLLRLEIGVDDLLVSIEFGWRDFYLDNRWVVSTVAEISDSALCALSCGPEIFAKGAYFHQVQNC